MLLSLTNPIVSFSKLTWPFESSNMATQQIRHSQLRNLALIQPDHCKKTHKHFLHVLPTSEEVDIGKSYIKQKKSSQTENSQVTNKFETAFDVHTTWPSTKWRHCMSHVRVITGLVRLDCRFDVHSVCFDHFNLKKYFFLHQDHGLLFTLCMIKGVDL